MKHSLLGTRKVISSIITRNFFVTEINNQWQSEPIECALVETTIASTPCAFHDNSRLQENSLPRFVFVSTCVIRVVLSVSYLLVSYFVMNFLRRIFSVCHRLRSMCQSGRMKGFERCFKVEDQGTWRRQNLHAAIFRPPAKRIQIKLYEPHLGKEKPVMGNIEPLLGIT